VEVVDVDDATESIAVENQGTDPAREGVSFTSWAFVLAGLDAGLAIEDLLTHLDLGEERWQRADEALNQALLDDVEAGGTLSETLDEAMRAARRSWTRAIPPLDVDLRAWLDFFRAWAADEAPVAFLDARGMRAADIHRLQEHWSARLVDDPSLRRDALAILEAPPGPVPEPHPEPLRLIQERPDPVGPDQTAPRVARARRAALPFAPGNPAPLPPPLSVPLPPPRHAEQRTRPDEMRVAPQGVMLEPALPFATPTDAPVEAEAPAHDASGDVGSSTTSDTGDPVNQFTVQRYADLCMDLFESTDGEEGVLRKYGITALQKAEVDAYWTQRMSADTALWLAWDRACAERRAANAEASL
jgi:hypothetical protein